ncbi:MAG TPA: hypothetical protein VLA45_08265 [Paracoccaceae bacterium]|nr:hypothetical protein [Paracoccaceae bacterium]
MIGQAVPHRLIQRLPALIALALPVLAGIACLAAFGAPGSYVAANAAGLALGLAALLTLSAPSVRHARILTLVLLALLFVPPAIGPEYNDISRWLGFGPVRLHAGMIAIPSLAVLAARDNDYTAPILLAALGGALLQPDAASGFALTIAAVGIHHATRDWTIGLTAIVGFFASLFMAVHGELPATLFVERVLVDYLSRSPLAALTLFATLAVSFLAMALAIPLERPARLALAGSLFGFSLMALLSNYPAALIGHGAAPIIGYGLALGLVRKSAA